MPTLIKEDGTNVANANSYASLADIRLYASDRGHDFADVDDDELSNQAIRAMDYILVYFGGKWKGVRSFTNQSLDWPRSNVELDGVIYTNLMPVELKNAQSALVIQQQLGIDIMPNYVGQQLKSEQMGPMRFEYFAPPSSHVKFPAVDYMLKQYINYAPSLVVDRA